MRRTLATSVGTRALAADKYLRDGLVVLAPGSQMFIW